MTPRSCKTACRLTLGFCERAAAWQAMVCVCLGGGGHCFLFLGSEQFLHSELVAQGLCPLQPKHEQMKDGPVALASERPEAPLSTSAVCLSTGCTQLGSAVYLQLLSSHGKKTMGVSLTCSAP